VIWRRTMHRDSDSVRLLCDAGRWELWEKAEQSERSSRGDSTNVSLNWPVSFEIRLISSTLLYRA